MVFVGCLLLFINTVILSDYHLKLQIAATEAAKIIDGQKYWLGAVRSDYNRVDAEKNAREVADLILEKLGLPDTSSFSVDYPSKATNTALGNIQLTRVTLAVNRLKTVGGLFAPFIELKGSGISSDGAMPPFAIGTLTFGDWSDLRTVPPCYRTFTFPIYAASSLNGQVTTYHFNVASLSDKAWLASYSGMSFNNYNPTAGKWGHASQRDLNNWR